MAKKLDVLGLGSTSRSEFNTVAAPSQSADVVAIAETAAKPTERERDERLLDERLDQLSEQVAELDMNLDTLKATGPLLDEQIEQLSAQVAELDLNLDKLKATGPLLDEQFEQLSEQVAELQVTLNTLETNVDKPAPQVLLEQAEIQKRHSERLDYFDARLTMLEGPVRYHGMTGSRDAVIQWLLDRFFHLERLAAVTAITVIAFILFNFKPFFQWVFGQ